MMNGDRITGEVKRLERGKLEFKTDDMGTIYIEWDKVARLRSNQHQDVELASGEHLYGRLTASENDGKLAIADQDSGTVTPVSNTETVRMTPLMDADLWRNRFDGYVDFGFTTTKATDTTQLTVDAGIRHRDRVRYWDLSLTTIQSDTKGTDSSSTSLIGENRRFLRDHWFWSNLLALTRNDELGLDLRTLFSGALGRYVVQTGSQELGLSAGLALSRERLIDDPTVDSIELLFMIGYDAFRFDSPNLDLQTRLAIFPSLTISGRVRTEASANLRYEIVNDLYVGLSLSHSYDNTPPTPGAPTNDYAITTSLGYSF